MGALDTLVTYITDKERRLSTKTYVTIICLTLVIILDNVIGVSYHYSVDKKLSELQITGQILKDTTLDKNTRLELTTLRNKIIARKHYSDQFTDAIKTLFKKEITTIQTSIPIKETPTPRNNFWFLMSVSGIYLLLYLIILIVFPFMDKGNSIGQKIAIVIIFIVFAGLNALLYYWLFGFIPKLGDTWTWNYVLNFVVQIILFALTITLIMKEVKKKNSH
jgi:hypothetical protein